METQQITEFSIVEHIYKTRMKHDFARNELKPLSGIRRAWNRDAYVCYALMDHEELLGYAFFVRKDCNYLFDYFAIEETHRDRGLGSIFLKQLANCFPSAACIVGEVEDPDKAENEEEKMLRERRMQFYLRNGYRKTDVTSTVFGVAYRVLEIPTGKERTAEDLVEIYTDLYRSILPKLFFRTQFKAGIG